MKTLRVTLEIDESLLSLNNDFVYKKFYLLGTKLNDHTKHMRLTFYVYLKLFKIFYIQLICYTGVFFFFFTQKSYFDLKDEQK